MIRLASLLGFAALALVATACGGGSGTPDALISFADAGPPDAEPPPDAFVCVETDTRKNCGEGEAGCVNITTDPANCGGCTMACQAGAGCVAGQGPIDGGVDIAHCECPADFLPDDIMAFLPPELGIPAINGIPNQPGDYAGLGIFFGDTLNALVVSFSLGDGDAGTSASPLDTPIDLSMVTGLVPSVGIGHNIDTTSFMPQGAYRATGGTLEFDSVCDVGASGSVTNGVFIAVAGLMDPTPVDGGCTFTASFTWSVGDACP